MSTIQAEQRSADTTRSALRQLRSSGKIPAVIYGKTTDSEAITLDAKDVMRLLRSNSGGIVKLHMPTGDAERNVMIADIQRDKLKGTILHMDLHQVNMDEDVRTTVRLQYNGEPVGVKQGGVLQTLLHSLDIRCKPNNIPAVIEIDLDSLDIGDTISIESVPVPEGVEITNDPSDVLVTVLHAQKEEEEETDAEEAAPSEDASEGEGESEEA